MTYTTEPPPLTVVELFAGYGSQRLGLERLKRDFPPFDYKVLAIAEIENYALAAYEAIHGDCPNLGSVTDIVWEEHPELKDVGLLTYSFPCQDISAAGKQRGFEKGSNTRSGLLWECERAIRVLRPKYLLMENVAAIMQKKFLPHFKEWQECLEGYGYTNFTSLINSKDLGVPQNRLRCFMVSILGDASFEFPKPFPLEKRLHDVLEESVDESYYLKDEQVERILAHTEKHKERGNGFSHKFVDPNSKSGGVCGTITGNYGQRETDTYLKVNENIIPINTTKDGLAPCLPSHYYKAGWSDFTPKQHDEPARHLAVFVIDEIVPQNKEIIGEPKIMQIGSYSPSSACNAKVLDPDGICPTLLDHKGAEPAILTPIRTETQRQLRKQGIDTFGGRQLLPRTDGLSNTITTVQKDNLLQEPLISVHPLSHALEFKGGQSIKEISPALRATDYKCPHCVYEPQVIGSMQANAMRGSLDCVSTCLTEAMGMGGGQIPMITELQKQELYEETDKRRISSINNEADTREILSVLRQEVGEETYQRTFRRLSSILEKEILRLAVYEDGIRKERANLSELGRSSCVSTENCISDREPSENMRNLRFHTECGHTPQGWQPSEQYIREFDACLSELPHETPQAKECLQNLQQRMQNNPWDVQQALSQMEEIWRPQPQAVEYISQIRYRIRKLTPRECFRLQGVDDADIDKIDAYPFKSIGEKDEYFASMRNEIETLEAELSELKAELKDAKYELNASKSDKKELRRKVTETNKRLRSVKKGLSLIKRQSIPKSAKYKLAGNSIVVDVLYRIFHQMFIAEPPTPQPRQMSLFGD